MMILQSSLGVHSMSSNTFEKIVFFDSVHTGICLHVCLSTTCMQFPQRSEEAVRVLRMDLEVIVSHHVGNGEWNHWALCITPRKHFHERFIIVFLYQYIWRIQNRTSGSYKAVVLSFPNAVTLSCHFSCCGDPNHKIILVATSQL